MEREDLASVVERIRQGDSHAEEELHLVLAPALRRYVSSHLGPKLLSRLDPEDVVQETLSSLLFRLREGEPKIHHIERFCRAVARHVMHRESQRRSVDFQRLRAAEASNSGGSLDLPAPAAGPRTVFVRRERKRRLEEALKALTPRQAEVVRLRFQHSNRRMRFKEIAQRLGMKPEAAEKTYLRALEQLKKHLKGRPRRPDESGDWFE